MGQTDDWDLVAPTCDDDNCVTGWRHRITGDVKLRAPREDDPSTEVDVVIPAAAWAAMYPNLG